MSYWSDLAFLERGLQAGAIPGEDAVSTLMALDEQRRAQMQARRQAAQEAAMDSQSGALDFLQKQAFEAVGNPSTAQDVMRLTQANSMFQGGNPAGALDTLFLPQTGSPSGYVGNRGQSRIDPSLRPEDIEDAQAALQAGEPPQNIMAGLQEIYGPKTYSRLLPEIQTLLGL